jgi:hypothetical protein
MHPEGVPAAAPCPAASSPQARASRLFTVTASNNGAAGAATNMLVAVQGLWIIAASVTLRQRRPQAAGAPACS